MRERDINNDGESKRDGLDGEIRKDAEKENEIDILKQEIDGERKRSD